MKLSKRSRISILLFIFYGLDKVLAVARQVIIARQFGLSPELDVFNIANNLPDMLFTLISGGALSMALIPVMADVIRTSGKKDGWKLFSSVANLAFFTAALISIGIAVFAEPIVRSEIGIAPGFSAEQQQLVVNLMRLNLIATLIFSLSGLVMGGLQANGHFLLPAAAPIFYNLGQIFGAVVMAPETPYQLGPFSLPCMGMGIYGLVGGVILGAAAHLMVQIPALFRNQFGWSPRIEWKNNDVKRVLRILGPRLISVFCVQMIFIVRDNFASRLADGSVTALSYGYMLQQFPETLIGTAIGTAILPSISCLVSEKKAKEFSDVIEKALKISFALSLGIAVIMGLGMGPLVGFVFGMDGAQNRLMMLTLRGFLAGLAGHCMLEILNRAFYAQEEGKIPLFGTILNLALYIGVGALLYRRMGAPGISLTDSIAFTAQALLMLVLLCRWKKGIRISVHPIKTMIRSIIGTVVSAAVYVILVQGLLADGDPLMSSILGMIVGMGVYTLFILPELKLLKNF